MHDSTCDAPKLNEEKSSHLLLRLIKGVGYLVGCLVLLLMVAWVYGALVIDGGSQTLGVVYLLLNLLAVVGFKKGWHKQAAVVGMVGLALVWWFSLEPRQDRDWKPEVAQTAWYELDGDRLTIHQVRNNDYRTETDFTARYETREYRMSQLKGVDIFINYWGSPYMAHPIVSYDFGPDGHVCFSIETRTEKGEGYSAIRGLYRQFEVIYVVADERDVIRLRANYRKGEDVYRYRLQAVDPKQSLMGYLKVLNELHQKPEWYHALSHNCTTSIRQQRSWQERSPFDWRMIVNGFMDEMLYERKAIESDLPFADLKKRAYMNPRIHELDQDPDFSAKLRMPK